MVLTTVQDSSKTMSSPSLFIFRFPFKKDDIEMIKQNGSPKPVIHYTQTLLHFRCGTPEIAKGKSHR
ncbi:hypothetical protein PsorP6_017070 [Peronosclerospora sorghi]|uniref:Uncharacterized protein n=1 Tax=Peronosclerospora sorghi TaxID=230839 RepID=A0ACC0WCH6_9STRA|nr:hypothetical protein PsorP6_017070 [Peronosclerospora sorghi]